MSQISRFDVQSLHAERPRHIAIIMDGNGRWAQQRNQARPQGHREGVKAVRRTIEACQQQGIEIATLFAFSSENWRRPRTEVNLLIDLLISTLRKEMDSLRENKVQVRFIGDRNAFSEKLRDLMVRTEANELDEPRLLLNIALNYGGRWDIAEAARQLAGQVAAGKLQADDIDEDRLAGAMSLADLPEPDLFIRTGGEQRISNFLLWQLAYTELYFTDVLWPDFNEHTLHEALNWFAGRQRRFGHTGEQVERLGGA